MQLSWHSKSRKKKAILKAIYQDNNQVFNDIPVRPKRNWSKSISRHTPLFALPLLLFLTGSVDSHYATLSEYTPLPNIEFFLDGHTSTYASTDTTTSTMSQQTINSAFNLLSSPQTNAQTNESKLWPDLLKRNYQPTPENLLPANAPALRQVFGLGIKTIVIDPGHGGTDPGTSGHLGLEEKEITLGIARRLKRKLESSGDYRVHLTRNNDRSLPLKQRIDFANNLQADLFISIHVNYIPKVTNNMIETYYYGVPENDNEAALKLAELENQRSQVSLSEFNGLVKKVSGTLKLQESQRLASEIQHSLYSQMSKDSNLKVIDMGIRKAPFLVILGTEMPAVLAEVTCLSNREEEIKLRTSNYRNKIATHLETGITNYLNKGDFIYEASNH